MELFGSNLRFFKKRETPAPTTTLTKEDNAPVDQRSANWQGNIITPRGMKSLMVPAWYRGVSLIMQTMGQMVTQYQYKDKEGGNYVEARWGDSRRLNYLLQVRPNPYMAASQMQEQIEFCKIYFGNAYIYIERNDDGTERALWLCTDGHMNIGQNTYWLQYTSAPGYVRTLDSVPMGDVLHFRNVFLTPDLLYGIPTLDFAMKSLQLSATGDDQALQDLAKGGKYKVLLQEKDSAPVGTRGRANANSLKDITRRFREDWTANDVLLLDNVADAKMLSQTAQQLQLLESRGFEVKSLARLLGIPLAMMMEGDGGSYKMPELATQEFMLRTIQPRIREHEDEMNSKLLSVYDFGKARIHICEQALRRLDPVQQANLDKSRLETGAMTINEIRQQYDQPAVENGDEPMASANLMTLKALIAKSESATAPQPIHTAATDGSPVGTDKKPTAQEGEEQ
jgi:HK97 family phage portal protein